VGPWGVGNNGTKSHAKEESRLNKRLGESPDSQCCQAFGPALIDQDLLQPERRAGRRCRTVSRTGRRVSIGASRLALRHGAGKSRGSS
jgi:hypothetical protein